MSKSPGHKTTLHFLAAYLLLRGAMWLVRASELGVDRVQDLISPSNRQECLYLKKYGAPREMEAGPYEGIQ
jgi:hypothetical protein